MCSDKSSPPLKFLHAEDSLISSKVQEFDRLSTEILLQTLAPGQSACLKTRLDGTIIDGHHRIHVLRKREIDVDALPREVILKEEFE
jgi:hypothetical protein